MEKIDWSKAPEGATHHVFTGGLDNHHCWYRVRDGGYDFQYSDEMRGWKKGKFQSPASDRLTARPSPAWSGEGIPAAGSICEVRQKTPCESSFDWEECRIAMINTGADGLPQVCTIDKRGDLAIYYPATDVVEFRPIRTPEQIAKDEREAAIKEMLEDAGRPDTAKTRDQAQLLYDAGWRKVERAQ